MRETDREAQATEGGSPTARASGPSGAGSADGLSVTRTCTSTGLALQPSAVRKIWRVAKTSYGPLGPRVRDHDLKRKDWGRYDVPGHRTVYGACPRVAAYGESIAFAQEALPDVTAGELYPISSPGDATPIREYVRQEFRERGFMELGTLPAAWRHERLIYQLTLPQDGWFVDIESADSVAVLSHALARPLAALGIDHLTVAHLRGEDRRLTTMVAEWVHGLVLDDGSQPHGIRYCSKHGTDWSCWAVWLRHTDAGKGRESEPTTADQGAYIEHCDQNPDLAAAARLFGLRCF